LLISYNGFGFPIILEKAIFKKIHNKCLLKIDAKAFKEPENLWMTYALQYMVDRTGKNLN
jgi:hypothetical protein